MLRILPIPIRYQYGHNLPDYENTDYICNTLERSTFLRVFAVVHGVQVTMGVTPPHGKKKHCVASSAM